MDPGKNIADRGRSTESNVLSANYVSGTQLLRWDDVDFDPADLLAAEFVDQCVNIILTICLRTPNVTNLNTSNNRCIDVLFENAGLLPLHICHEQPCEGRVHPQRKVCRLS
jgi:hypothetical protein